MIILDLKGWIGYRSANPPFVNEFGSPAMFDTEGCKFLDNFQVFAGYMTGPLCEYKDVTLEAKSRVVDDITKLPFVMEKEHPHALLFLYSVESGSFELRPIPGGPVFKLPHWKIHYSALDKR